MLRSERTWRSSAVADRARTSALVRGDQNVRALRARSRGRQPQRDRPRLAAESRNLVEKDLP
jgi:hypothetical protein